MKGLILAGGSGTRLYPITKGISKQLMPIYDKPMIYYPLSTLMGAGINEILIITTPNDNQAFKNLLGDGSEIGCKLSYAIQDQPLGLAQAFVLGKEFIGEDSCCLVLGDNLFYGEGIDKAIIEAKANVETNGGGVIFGYQVQDPERYGVVQFDDDNNVISIEEKPKAPKSNYAIPGIYFFDNKVSDIALKSELSERGEYEITSVQNAYLDSGTLQVNLIQSRGNAWLDTGTFESMMQASQFIQVIEQRQGSKIGCIEEIAFKAGFIDEQKLYQLAQPLLKSGYGRYLLELLPQKTFNSYLKTNQILN